MELRGESPKATWAVDDGVGFQTQQLSSGVYAHGYHAKATFIQLVLF